MSKSMTSLASQPSKEEFRVVVLIAKHISASQFHGHIECLNATTVVDIRSKDADLFQAICLLQEINKPDFNYQYDEYLLDYEPFLLSYPSFGTFRDCYVFAKLTYPETLSSAYRFSSAHQLQICSINNEFSEIYNSLMSHHESLESWQACEPSSLKDIVVERRERRLAQLQDLIPQWRNTIAVLSLEFL